MEHTKETVKFDTVLVDTPFNVIHVHPDGGVFVHCKASGDCVALDAEEVEQMTQSLGFVRCEVV